MQLVATKKPDFAPSNSAESQCQNPATMRPSGRFLRERKPSPPQFFSRARELMPVDFTPKKWRTGAFCAITPPIFTAAYWWTSPHTGHASSAATAQQPCGLAGDFLQASKQAPHIEVAQMRVDFTPKTPPQRWISAQKWTSPHRRPYLSGLHPTQKWTSPHGRARKSLIFNHRMPKSTAVTRARYLTFF